jgi:hypothetical protein
MIKFGRAGSFGAGLMQEDTMATLTHESDNQFVRERARDRDSSSHTHLIAGFGIAIIVALVAVYALAVSSGIEPSQIELMSVFP